MRHIGPIAAAAAALALASPAALAQVNNGVGIGPSSELERPDLQRRMAPHASTPRHAGGRHRAATAPTAAATRPTGEAPR